VDIAVRVTLQLCALETAERKQLAWWDGVACRHREQVTEYGIVDGKTSLWNPHLGSMAVACYNDDGS
jgi:hypothetical protein